MAVILQDKQDHLELEGALRRPVTSPLQPPGEQPFSRLNGYKYIMLTTYRRSGKPVPTTVWFAQQGGKVFVTSSSDSGKVKRIRHNSRVLVAPSNAMGKPLGSSLEASARVLSVTEQEQAAHALAIKYGWQLRIFELIWRLGKRPHVYIEIATTS